MGGRCFIIMRNIRMIDSLAMKPQNAQRRILSVLRHRRHRHLSVGEIHTLVNRSGPAVHLATVYRALQRLLASGQVKRTSLAQNHAHYEINDNQGVHLLCEACGRVEERKLAEAERMIKDIDRRLEGRFKVRTWQLQFTGRCRQCSKIKALR